MTNIIDFQQRKEILAKRLEFKETLAKEAHDKANPRVVDAMSPGNDELTPDTAAEAQKRLRDRLAWVTKRKNYYETLSQPIDRIGPEPVEKI